MDFHNYDSFSAAVHPGLTLFGPAAPVYHQFRDDAMHLGVEPMTRAHARCQVRLRAAWAGCNLESRLNGGAVMGE
jgi:hypothetical protein